MQRIIVSYDVQCRKGQQRSRILNLRRASRARRRNLRKRTPRCRSSHGARPCCRPVNVLVDGPHLERLKHPTNRRPLLPVPDPVPRSMLLDGPHAKRSNTIRNVAGPEPLAARTARWQTHDARKPPVHGVVSFRKRKCTRNVPHLSSGYHGWLAGAADSELAK